MKRIEVTKEMQTAMSRLMQQKGWNLSEIAGYLNVSTSTAQRILNGAVSRCGENVARRLEEMGEKTGVYYDRAGKGETEKPAGSQGLQIPAGRGVTINITTHNLYLYITGEDEESKGPAGAD